MGKLFLFNVLATYTVILPPYASLISMSGGRVQSGKRLRIHRFPAPNAHPATGENPPVPPRIGSDFALLYLIM